METDNAGLVDVIVKQIEVKPYSVLVFQLNSDSNFQIAQDLGVKLSDAFGDIPFVMLFVDDINYIENVPEQKMQQFGWVKVRPKDTVFGKIMKRLGYTKVK